jgi:hypothetical protein
MAGPALVGEAEQRVLNAILFRAAGDGHNVISVIERGADPR